MALVVVPAAAAAAAAQEESGEMAANELSCWPKQLEIGADTAAVSPGDWLEVELDALNGLWPIVARFKKDEASSSGC